MSDYPYPQDDYPVDQYQEQVISPARGRVGTTVAAPQQRTFSPTVKASKAQYPGQ